MAYLKQTFGEIQFILDQAIKGRRIDYGTAPLAIANQTSSGLLSFIGNVQRHAPEINEHFENHYANGFVSIFEYNLANQLVNSFLNKQFASKADLMAFCSYNCQTANGIYSNNIIASFYDFANDDVPKISKIYGMNSFYSMLMGSNRSQSSQPCLNYNNINWGSFGSWFEHLCNQNAGFPPGYTFNPNDNAFQAIWVSRNVKKRFQLPRTGFSNVIPKVNGLKRYWAWGDSDWNRVLSFKEFRNAGVYYYYFNLITQNYQFSTSISQYDAVSKFHSFIALYKLQDINDANNIGFLLKPVGIDSIYLNWFNTSKYDLYAHYQENGKRPKIRKIGDQFDANDVVSNSIRVKKEQWLNDFYNYYLSYNSQKRGPAIRFFLKDKETGFSGYLSKKQVIPRYDQQDIPVLFMVN